MSVLDNAKFELSATREVTVITQSLEEASAFFEKNWSKSAVCTTELDDNAGTQFTIECDGGTFMLQPIPVSALDKATIEAIKLVTAALED